MIACATAWDSETPVLRAKLEAHAAVGAELAVIPGELDEALALKTRLLRGGERRCGATFKAASELERHARRAARRARAWAKWYEQAYACSHGVQTCSSSDTALFKTAATKALAQQSQGAFFCAKAETTSDAVLRLEDERSDALSALEKCARRASHQAFVPRSRTYPPRDDAQKFGGGAQQFGGPAPLCLLSGERLRREHEHCDDADSLLLEETASSPDERVVVEARAATVAVAVAELKPASPGYLLSVGDYMYAFGTSGVKSNAGLAQRHFPRWSSEDSVAEVSQQPLQRAAVASHKAAAPASTRPLSVPPRLTDAKSPPTDDAQSTVERLRRAVRRLDAKLEHAKKARRRE